MCRTKCLLASQSSRLQKGSVYQGSLSVSVAGQVMKLQEFDSCPRMLNESRASHEQYYSPRSKS